MKKKIAVGLGTLIGLLLLTALIVPFVVDVDQYRPKIIELSKPYLTGQLQMGKLSLSLWGQIRIDVQGVELLDSQGSEVMGVKDAYFHVPFLSIFSGAPIFTFKMSHPLIKIIQGKDGKSNLQGLLKERKSEPMDLSKYSGFLANARLGIDVNDAMINFKSQATGFSTQLSGLRFALKDLSLTHPTLFEISAELNTQMGKDTHLKGPVRAEGQILPDLISSHASLKASVNLNQLTLSVKDGLEKSSSDPLSLELEAVCSMQEMTLTKFLLKAFNAEMEMSGKLSRFDQMPHVALDLQLSTHSIQLKPWNHFLASLKDLEINGEASIDAKIEGVSPDIVYDGHLIFEKVSFEMPQVKTRPDFSGKVHFVTNAIESMSILLKAPETEILLKGKVPSLQPPKVSITISSNKTNLDAWVDFPPAEKKSAEGTKEEGKSTKSVAPEEDYDAKLASYRAKPWFRDGDFQFQIDLKNLKVKQAEISSWTCQAGFKGMQATMDACRMNVMGSKIQLDTAVQMKSSIPSYQFQMSFDQLDLAKVLAVQMPIFKNTFSGMAQMNMKGSGSSFNSTALMSALNATGRFDIAQARFLTIDVMKMVKDALNDSLGKIADQVPPLKGKRLTDLPSHASEYERISSDFSISGGKFQVSNFKAQAAPRKGIDVSGKMSVGMVDDSINADWEVSDTYNLTHARDLSIEQQGVKVEHILAENGSPVKFPVQIGCTIKSPCPSYARTPTYLAKIALGNVAQGVKGKAKEEVSKKAESVIEQVAPPAVKEHLKNQLRGLFR